MSDLKELRFLDPEGMVSRAEFNARFERLMDAAFYNPSGKPHFLGNLQDGETFQLKENGILTDFVKLRSGYEGSGRTLVIRKNKMAAMMPWGTSGAPYANGTLDNFCETTYMNTYLDQAVTPYVSAVSIPVYTSPNQSTLGRISRRCFVMSHVEAGFTNSSDGTKINALSSLKLEIGMMGWTRTPNSSTEAFVVNAASITSAPKTNNQYFCPMFTLPADFVIKRTPIVTSINGDLLTLPSLQLDSRVQIKTLEYTGTGTAGPSNPTLIIIGFTPKMVMIEPGGSAGYDFSQSYPSLFWRSGFAGMNMTTPGSSSGRNMVTSPFSTFVWHNIESHAVYQANAKDTIYRVIAIG